jgi:hypothetical protein
MPVTANRKQPIFFLSALIAALLIAVIVRYTLKSGGSGPNTSVKVPPRPAADSPRGVLWDLWHAAMDNDRERVRAALLTTTDAHQQTADALAKLLTAEAAFARQLQHTWPLSPTSRDGGGTWFGEGGDTGLLTARENIDAAAIHATVNMHGTPVKLVRGRGEWKIDTMDLARARLKRSVAAEMADAPQQLAAMADAYRDLRAEIAALHIASPSAAIEQLRKAMPATAATTP